MGTESKHEQIMAALASKFETTIVADNGVNYWYSPKVDRVAAITPECLQETKDCAYYLVPDEEDVVEQAGKIIAKEAYIDIVLLKQFRVSSEVPHDQVEPIRWTVQNRLAQDAEKVLYANAQISHANNVRVTTIDRSAERTYVKGWACVFIRARVEYDHHRSEP